MPSILPRRQTTSHGCRLRSSGVNASSKRAGTTDDPAGTILAPRFEISMIWHAVMASPFMIQADCCRIPLRRLGLHSKVPSSSVSWLGRCGHEVNKSSSGGALLHSPQVTGLGAAQRQAWQAAFGRYGISRLSVSRAIWKARSAKASSSALIHAKWIIRSATFQ
jgi:hypothetical protein